jgi:hypothetical protein
MDHVQVMQQKIESLHHVCLELIGVISEFRSMPCRSLEDAMFKTADRYKKRVQDNAPDSTMYMSMSKVAENDGAAPVYVNAGRRLIVILRKAGAPEGRESEALQAFIYLRDALTDKLNMLDMGIASDVADASVLSNIKRIKIPPHGTEGQKVVEMAFAQGAMAGRARFWLNSLLEDVAELNAKVNARTVAGY